MHEDFQKFQGNVLADLNLSARKNGRGYTIPIKVPRQITYSKRNNTPKKSSTHEDSLTDVCRLATCLQFAC